MTIDELSLGLGPILSGVFAWVWAAGWLVAVGVSLLPLRRLGLWFNLPAFFSGWFLSELPIVHLAALWVVEGPLLGSGGLRVWQGKAGLALSVLASFGLGVHVWHSLQVPRLAARALREALGADYVDRLPEDFDHRAGFPPLRLFLFLWLRDGSLRVVRNVPYVPGGGRRQRLDIYMPAKPVEGAPVVFQVHGGAWVVGDKAQQARPLLNMLARRGFVCVSINYRLSPRARWPDPLIDAKRALAWTRAHIADYGGDPERIVVTGGSAGGQLVSLLALTANQPALQPGFEDADTRVQAAVPFYGIYDFLDRHGLKPHADLARWFRWVVVRRSPHTHPELYDSASPVVHVRADAPPFFVIHGSADTLAPVEEARLFVQRLRAVSRAPVAYLELPYVHHMFETFHSLRTLHVARAVHVFATLHTQRASVASHTEAGGANCIPNGAQR